MDYERVLAGLKEIAPAHCKDLLDALEFVAQEFENSRAIIDRECQRATMQNRYQDARKLLAISEELHVEQETMYSLIQRFRDVAAEPMEVDSSQVASEDTAVEREYVDYDAYRVDETVAYDLQSTELTFTRPAAISFKGAKRNAETWKQALLISCTFLKKENPTLFHNLIDREPAPGRRPYFTKNKASLRSPGKIPGTTVYVETNRSAENVKQLMLKLLELFGVPQTAIKIYLARDYTSLHESDN